jgi:hypothetical protein
MVTDEAPAAVDCAPLPAAVEPFWFFIQRRVWLEPAIVLPFPTTSTVMSPGALVTVTWGFAPEPKLVVTCASGVDWLTPVKLIEPASTSKVQLE